MNSQEEIRKVKEAVTKIGEQIQEKRKLLKQESNKINAKVFENVVLAIFIMLYVIFLNLGFVNIERSVYITDLKVFSASLLILAIILFEKAYTKENSILGIHGIESLVLGFITMFLIYDAIKYPSSYIFISLSYAYLFAAYYIIKATIIAVKMKKEYRDKLSDMKEIVKKIKPVKKEAFKRKKEESKEKIEKQEQTKSKAEIKVKVKASKSEAKPVKQEKNTSRKTTNQTKTKKKGENKVAKTTTKTTAKSSSKSTAQSTKKINKKAAAPEKKTAKKETAKSKTTTKTNATKTTSTKKKSSSSVKKVAPKKEEKKEQSKAKTSENE